MAAAAAIVGVKEALPESKLAFDALLTQFRTHTNRKLIDQYARKAIEAGQLSMVIDCVRQHKKSHITFRSPGVLKHTLRGLRAYPQESEWSKPAVQRALRRSSAISTLLDSEEAGFGRQAYCSSKDPRRQPAVLGTFLELAAVNAYKHTEGNDRDGMVKAAATRLLSCIHTTRWEYQKLKWEAPKAGQVDIVLDTVPIWHGLSLAQKILKRKMPQFELAKDVIAVCDQGLKQVVEQIRATNPAEGTYGEEALRTYDECIATEAPVTTTTTTTEKVAV